MEEEKQRDGERKSEKKERGRGQERWREEEKGKEGGGKEGNERKGRGRTGRGEERMERTTDESMRVVCKDHRQAPPFKFQCHRSYW